jgi:hypothetical protein
MRFVPAADAAGCHSRVIPVWSHAWAKETTLSAGRDGRRVAPAFPPDQEVAVAVILVHQGAGVTRDNYEETVRRLTNGKSRMESPADWPVEGVLVHTAGESESGFRIVDVWESEESARRFGETLIPLLKEVGIQAEPEMYPAHTFVSA